MRPLVLALLLATTLAITAQSPQQDFRAAEQQWQAHRPDGLTWDDGSPEAAQALNEMWTAVVASANDFLVTHPTASPAQLKQHLEQPTPITKPAFGNNLSATVLPLGDRLYAIAFNDAPAATVFVLRPHAGSPIVWRLDGATAQARDHDNLLRAWKTSRADEQCEKREPNSLFFTCGPLNGTIGQLPTSSTGAPRFYIDATYSKDAGASMANQISIWEWEGSAPALLWIDHYLIHAGATRPVTVHGATLTFGEQDEYQTFSACMACDSRQLLHTVQVKSADVKDMGAKPLYPELDRADRLIAAIAFHRPTQHLASTEVVDSLRADIQKALAHTPNHDPKDFSVGMLDGWSVTHTNTTDENVCIITDDLARLDFTYDPTPKTGGFFKSMTRNTKPTTPCPTNNALRAPYAD